MKHRKVTNEAEYASSSIFIQNSIAKILFSARFPSPFFYLENKICIKRPQNTSQLAAETGALVCIVTGV